MLKNRMFWLGWTSCSLSQLIMGFLNKEYSVVTTLIWGSAGILMLGTLAHLHQKENE